MTKLSKPEYLSKVAKLSKAETERILSRMSGKLPRQLGKDRLSQEEAIAIQLEIEDDQLQDWRKMVHYLREKETLKAAEKEAERIKAEANKNSKVEDKPKTDKKEKKSSKKQVLIADIAPKPAKSKKLKNKTATI